MSRHLKKYAAPTTWPITRKDRVYITKPSPGAHSQKFGTSIDLILRTAGYAKTKREIKKILNTKEITIDGKKITNPKTPTGIFDSLSFPALNQHFRIILDQKGQLKLLAIQKNDADKKFSKIIGKKTIKGGKTQLNLSDGRNIITNDKKYATGDTLLIEVPSQKINTHLKLETGVCIYVIDGKYRGQIGNVETTDNTTITYTNTDKQKVQTLKKYTITVGKEQPLLKIQ